MPKFAYLLCLMANLLLVRAAAQTGTDKAYEIKIDTVSKKWSLPAAYMQRLDDASGKLTIADVNSPAISAKFHLIDSGKQTLVNGLLAALSHQKCNE